MEEWQVDFKWLELRHKLKEQFKKASLPDLNAILFLIGMQEVGQTRKFTKEEKQDLMHVAICRLLEKDDIYEFIGQDDDGWPHFEINRQLPKLSRQEQEELLKLRIIDYFENIW